MTRQKRAQTKDWLKWIADGLAEELSDVTYEQWLARPSRETQERSMQGARVQIEIQRLETTPTYIQVGVSVDDGKAPFVCRPVTRMLFVDRESDNPL